METWLILTIHDSYTYRIGVTGYITGDALYALMKKHPEFEYAALVRSEPSAKRVSEAFPNVRIVIGSLDDADVVKKEAAWADLVLGKYLHTS